MLGSLRSPKLSTRRLVAGLAAVAIAAGALGACTSAGDDATGTTTTTPLLAVDVPTGAMPVVTVPEGFVAPDTRGAVLLPFESRPGSRPPLPVYGGTSSLRGVVAGPDGPVEGATVRVERVIGDRVGAITLTSGAGGAFDADRLLGGHYRVRAWLQPSLATTRAAVAFLAAIDGSAEVTVDLESFSGRQLQAVLDVADPTVGSPARVRALFTQQTVNENGIVVGQGLGGASVRLNLSEGFAIRDGASPTTSTNSEGIASWPVECAREGSHSATVSTEAESVTVNLPSCGPRPSTTTTTTTPDDLDVPDFPVGEEFDVPYSGIVPAGIYRTFLDDCETTYQVYLNGEWREERRSSTGEIRLTVPARDFRPAPDTDGCSYQRAS